ARIFTPLPSHEVIRPAREPVASYAREGHDDLVTVQVDQPCVATVTGHVPLAVWRVPALGHRLSGHPGNFAPGYGVDHDMHCRCRFRPAFRVPGRVRQVLAIRRYAAYE